MTWLSALPVAVVAGFWVLGPGLMVGYASGLRGQLAWGVGPLLSVLVIAVSAVVAGTTGIAWGPLVPLGATVLLAALLAGSRQVVRRWPPGDRDRRDGAADSHPRAASARIPERFRPGSGGDGHGTVRTSASPPWPTSAQRAGHQDGASVLWCAVAGTVGIGGALAAGWVTIVRGMSRPDTLSQTFDAVFHYSAVEYILTTGNASSTALGTMTNPNAASSFYPGAWHDLVSLAVLSGGGQGGVVAATNAVAFVVAALVWPLSCLALARQLFGRSVAAALLTPVLSAGFTAFPWNLMSFGVLWPNLLGVALLPAALAAVVTVFGLARRSVLGRVGAVVLAGVAVPALGLAHPNAVFSLAVLGLFPMLWALARLVRTRLLTRHWYVPVIAVAVVGAVLGVLGWLMIASPLLAGVRSFDWRAFTTPAGAAYDVLANGMNKRPDSWAVSVLILLGAVFALRRTTTSWLVPAHLASGFLYLLAAAEETNLSAALTGAWYNDSYRLAATVPITGVPLAALGLIGIAGLARRAACAWAIPDRVRATVPAAVAAASALVIVAVSGGYGLSIHAAALAGPYQDPGDVLLVPGQHAFLDEAGRLLPEAAVVASNPFTGNALLYPLTGRRVLFPHMTGNWTPDQRIVATKLRDVASDPSVCAAVRSTGTTHVMTGPITFWPWHNQARTFPGLNDIAGVPGFELMADDGHNQLYRITACGPAELTDS